MIPNTNARKDSMNARRISAPVKAISIALVAVVVLVGPGESTSGAEDGKITARYVKVDGLRSGQVLWIRSGPGKHFRRIGLLRHNTEAIRNYGCKQLASGYWCKIGYRGVRGWSSGRFLANDRSLRT
ncbi:SH3 domain-containing protein [Aestuariivirga sp.]|uniref:SH3 domain-containing protein n=1 Tax=Aestuariivirga sp. TaxID=2650926 RepID=UPI00391A560C